MIAFAALVAIAAFVPNASRASEARSTLQAQLAAVRNPRVLTSYAIIVMQMIAFWSLSTFIAPYFTEAGGVGEDVLPLILFAFGIFGGVGIIMGGRYADRFPVRSITWSHPLMTLCFLVTWLGTAWFWPVGVLGLGLVWLVGSLAVIGVQNRILFGAAAAPELASSLISSVFNLGIAAGAALGSQALAGGLPVGQLPLISVAFAAAASATAFLATRGEAAVRILTPQKSASCSGPLAGTRKRSQLSGGSSASSPSRARAAAKRRAISSARTPSPCIRLPHSGS